MSILLAIIIGCFGLLFNILGFALAYSGINTENTRLDYDEYLLRAMLVIGGFALCSFGVFIGWGGIHMFNGTVPIIY